MRLDRLCSITLLAMLAGCSNAAEEGRVARLVLDQASFDTVPVCHGSGCTERTEVRLNDDDWSKVDAVFLAQAPSAQEERERIALAIGIIEILVGPQAGTRSDAGRNITSRHQGEQLDCVDEAVNTTTYLRLVAQRGLLRFHDVGLPANRLLDLVNAHNTAVVIDRATGIPYAVDSWFYANGSPAVILPLVAWRAGYDPLDDGPLPPAPDNAATAAQPAALPGSS